MRQPAVIGAAIGTVLVALLAGCGSSSPPQASTHSTTGTSNRAAAVRVVAAGDVACAPGQGPTRTSCRQAATARLIRSLGVDRVLALGDLQYEKGSYSAFTGSYDDSWGTFQDVTIPVPGNHEYKTAGAAGYYRYFGSVAAPAPGYSVATLGAWRVYLLNSNCDDIDCGEERRWLADDLDTSATTCTAMVMHHPRYSSGLEHGSDASMAPFWRIAYAHGVDLALAGHDHDYERFAPMDAGAHARPRRGITSFVVGTGGKSLYHRGREAPGSRYFRADRFGVLDLTLGPQAFSWRFRTIDGHVRDAGRRSCH
ncbi:metallophosphoesterase family protein [Nocardioides sp.]|uniref:metallophosphoesterase family protein n=1 Tax=Nocardioides sp. TaxID=35761 RepID=UPI003D09CB4A